MIIFRFYFVSKIKYWLILFYISILEIFKTTK